MSISVHQVDKLLKRSKSRIREAVDQATRQEYRAGLHWYGEAHDIARMIAQRYGFETERAAALLACLSPATSWERSIVDANGLATDLGFRCTTYQKQVNKAIDLLTGGEIEAALGGKKVRAFYECIANPQNEEHVVIDRHAARTALGIWSDKDAGYAASHRYDHIAAAYATVATERGERPCDLQAIAWVVQRRGL